MKSSRIAALIGILAIIAFGCGNDEGDTADATDSDAAAMDADAGTEDATDGDTAETAESDTMDTADADTMEATDAGRFVYAHPHPVTDLDPSSAFSTENVVLQNVYETLTRSNAPGAAELLAPLLAESWNASDDSMSWTFTLRDDVTFHDGTPMTADTVIASLQRTIDLGLGAAFILSSIDTMTAPDDHTVEFSLAWPTPLDLVMSSGYGAYIMSPDAVTQDSDWFNAGNAGGTGPYTISSFEAGGAIVLERYDDYWGGWTDGQFSEAEVLRVDDRVLAEQMVRVGDADFTYNLPFDSYDALDTEADLRVVRGQSMTNLFGLLNHQRLSPEVREALVLSFPYDDIVAALYGGQANRAQGIIPQALWGSSQDMNLPETDLERAAQILSDAGVSDLTVTYSLDAGTIEQQQIGEVWKANLATIGVDLVLEPLTFDARWELAQADPANAQDIFTMFWFPTYITPYDFLFSLFHTEEEPFFNLGYYSNEDFDTLINDADAASGTDIEAATEMFRQASQILIDENAAVFMLDVPETGVIRADVEGYVPNPAYSGVVRFYDLTRS